MMWYVKSRRAQTVHDAETWIEGGVSPTLTSFDNGDSRPTVVIAFHNSYRDGIRIQRGDTINTLSAIMGTGGNNVPFIAHESMSFDTEFGGYASVHEDISPLLKVKNTASVAIPIQDGRPLTKHQNGIGLGDEGDPSYTLDQTGAQSVAADIGDQHMIVRRLTPVECERLMGWDDDHTLHRADGKRSSDSSRYKMCGNGVASPVAQWIGEQIIRAHYQIPTPEETT